MNAKRLFFIGIGIIGLTLVGGALLYLKSADILKNRAQSLSDLRAEAEALDEKIINAKSIQKQLAALSDTEKLIDEVLPPKKIQSDIVGQLLEIGKSSGMNVENITFSGGGEQPVAPELSQTVPIEGVNGVRALPINITLEPGSFDELIAFLQTIETNRRKMQIDTISITPQFDANGNPNGLIDAQLTLNVYVLEEES